MATQNEIRQNITDQIIVALAAGTAPWRRPWNSDSNAGAPTNAVNGKKYSGVNPLLLQIAADHFGFKGKYWGTYRQWQDLGGQVTSRPSHVKAGEWGTEIVFCKPCNKTREEDGEKIEDKFWLLRTFTVFNIDQVSGLSVERFRVGNQPVTAEQIEQRYQQADAAIDATGADIRYGGNQAFYQTHNDFIQMPHRQQFAHGEYYETAFHELTHWSEHPKRLDWDRENPDNTYALGELIAELSSIFISGELGLPVEKTMDNHAAYLASWLKAMQNDTKFIFKAASQATKAADFILSFSRQPNAEVEAESELVA